MRPTTTRAAHPAPGRMASRIARAKASANAQRSQRGQRRRADLRSKDQADLCGMREISRATQLLSGTLTKMSDRGGSHRALLLNGTASVVASGSRMNALRLPWERMRAKAAAFWTVSLRRCARRGGDCKESRPQRSLCRARSDIARIGLRSSLRIAKASIRGGKNGAIGCDVQASKGCGRLPIGIIAIRIYYRQ
jgi:hypothetical protein